MLATRQLGAAPSNEAAVLAVFARRARAPADRASRDELDLWLGADAGG
jgi:hypothetical protein